MSLPQAAVLRRMPEAASTAIAAPDAAACVIRLVTDRDGFDALEAPWSALFDRAGRPDNVFQSFNWLWHWTRHFLDGSLRLSIVTGWSGGGRLVMVWPLVRGRRLGVATLSWMGEPASQYGDVLVEPGPASASLLRQGFGALCRLDADVAFLRKTRRTSPVAAILAEAGVVASSGGAPYLSFAGAVGFDDVEKRFSSKDRSSRRRLMRRLEEAGAIEFVTDASGEGAETLVRRAFALKTRSLQQRGLYSPALDDPNMRAFFLDAMTSAERPVCPMINAVLCDGVPIGVALSFTCKGEGFGHILAHDTAYDKQGVGVILAEQIFRTALARGLVRFDMLGPADAFKLKWASATVGFDDWAVPLTLKGSWFVRVWLGRLRPGLKRLADSAPYWLGSRLWPTYRWLRRMTGRSAAAS